MLRRREKLKIPNGQNKKAADVQNHESWILYAVMILGT